MMNEWGKPRLPGGTDVGDATPPAGQSHVRKYFVECVEPCSRTGAHMVHCTLATHAIPSGHWSFAYAPLASPARSECAFLRALQEKHAPAAGATSAIHQRAIGAGDDTR